MEKAGNNTVTHTGQKEDDTLTQKYIALISVMSGIEGRMILSEAVYLILNVLVLFFTVGLSAFLLIRTSYLLGAVEVAFIFFCLIIGMAISTYWVASAMRSQLKLKLHYFQIRYMERKMDCEGECIFSDSAKFFDPQIHVLESPDKKETLQYPDSGLTRMDGFIGASKPRYFSWFMPSLFLFIYWIIFIMMLFHI